MKSLEALVALNMLPRIGPIKSRALIQFFGSAEKVLATSSQSLQQVNGIGIELADIVNRWQEFADPKKEITEAKERSIKIITQEDPLFPKELLQMHDCPLLLYVWGDLLENDKHAIGIVGSRKTTRYGRDQAHRFSYQLANNGFTVISGLARGIDTSAHEGAIAAQGRTLAVIGSGLKQIYPPENMALAERIADENGAIISEFPLSTPPDKKTFPQRNRIVAGLSKALLVVECPERSGSLITANMAGDMGKQLFAIPGKVDAPSSSGCNALIRNGATLVTDPGQIMDDLQMFSFATSKKSDGKTVTPPKQKPLLDITPEERLILDVLEQEDAHIDLISEQTSLAVQDVSTLLLKLELEGHIHQLSGMMYSRTYV